MPNTVVIRCAVALLSFALLAWNDAAAQCGGRWLPGHGLSSPAMNVYATAVLPNGDLVCGGTVTGSSPNQPAPILRWTGRQWENLGTAYGPGASTAHIRMLVTLSDGSLLAGGFFSSISGVSINGLGLWDGTTWHDMGMNPLGDNDLVQAVVQLSDGSLIVGGAFDLAGGVLAHSIARRSPSGDWSAVGSGAMVGFSRGAVTSIAVLPGDQLMTGGYFTSMDGIPCTNLARWDASGWHAMSAGDNNTSVNCVTAMPNGDVVVGGNFSTIDGLPVNHIARWNSTGWHAMGEGLEGPFYDALASVVTNDGRLVVVGDFATADGVTVNKVAVWDGTAWAALGTGVDGLSDQDFVFAVAASPFDHHIFIGGVFSQTGGAATLNLARWDGQVWSSISPLPNKVIRVIQALDDGATLIGGDMTSFGSRYNYLGTWKNGVARDFGGGLNGPCYAVARATDNQIYAGGMFTKAGNVNASYVARWNGSNWSALGAGFNRMVRCLAIDQDGILYAGGDFNLNGKPYAIASWNGTQWSQMGGGISGNVYAIATLPNGDIVAAGQFSKAGSVSASNVARWNGTAWLPMGSGLDKGVTSMAVMPDGTLIAGGSFSKSGSQAISSVAAWDQSGWHALNYPGDIVGGPLQMTLDQTGRLIMAGSFIVPDLGGSVTVAIWNGHFWSTLAGVDKANGSVGMLANGDLLINGNFRTAAGQSGASIAIWTTRSPADFNDDGFLDFFDLNDFVTCFAGESCPPEKAADFNADGLVDIADFNDFIAAFEIGC